MLYSTPNCLGTMNRALLAPVQLECGPYVERIQRCFYRTRQCCRARSYYHYDELKFHIRGTTLVIKKRSVPTSNQRHHKHQEHREMRDSVARRKLSVDGHGEQAERHVPETAQSDFHDQTGKKGGLRITLPKLENQ